MEEGLLPYLVVEKDAKTVWMVQDNVDELPESIVLRSATGPLLLDGENSVDL